MRKSIYPFIKKREKEYKPQVPIIIRNLENGKYCRALALLDTGADRCLIPNLIALQLGLERNDDQAYYTSGISGEKIKTWKNVVEIGLLSNCRTEELINIPVIIGTLEKGDIPAIVGTNNFLEHCTVTVDYPNKTVAMESSVEIE